MTPQQKKEAIYRNICRLMAACKITDITMAMLMEDGTRAIINTSKSETPDDFTKQIAVTIGDGIVKLAGCENATIEEREYRNFNPTNN